MSPSAQHPERAVSPPSSEGVPPVPSRPAGARRWTLFPCSLEAWNPGGREWRCDSCIVGPEPDHVPECPCADERVEVVEAGGAEALHQANMRAFERGRTEGRLEAEGDRELTEQEARILVRYFDANSRTLPAIGPVGSALIIRLRESLAAGPPGGEGPVDRDEGEGTA